MLRKVGVRITIVGVRHIELFAIYKIGPIKAWHKWQLLTDTKLRKVRFQLQRKLRQSTSKGNEFSARVSVSEILCPDFRNTLRKGLPMHYNVIKGNVFKMCSRRFYEKLTKSFKTPKSCCFRMAPLVFEPPLPPSLFQ